MLFTDQTFINLLLLVSTIGGGGWWLSRQFNQVKTLIYTETDKVRNLVMAKLEYHEKHDDARFSELKNDIWQMRLINAARDGKLKDTKEEN